MAEIKISLAAARVNANMTQAQVAEKLNVSKNTIINWELGRADPPFGKVIALSEMYNIPVENIFLPSNAS